MPRKHTYCLILSLMAVLSVANAGDQEKTTPPDKIILAEGQVFDHNGAGVKDATVQLYTIEDTDQSNLIAETKTDTYGEFAIRHDQKRTGPHKVVFRKEGYTSVSSEVELGEDVEWPPYIDISFTGNLTLTGIVVRASDNTPIEGATVTAQSIALERSATTDEKGSFTVDGVVADGGSVTVDATDFAQFKTTLESLGNADPLNIKLLPDRILNFKTVDWQGQPIPDVEVNLLDPESRRTYNATSDEEGRFVLRGISLSTTILRSQVSHPDYVSDKDYTNELQLPELTEDNRESQHTLNLLSAGRIKGIITEADGKSTIQGVRVTIGADLNVGQLKHWTRLDGTYHIGGVPPGKNIITAYVRGYAPKLVRVDIKPNERTDVNFELTPSRGAGGILLNQDDDPVANAYVYATSWQGASTLGIQSISNDKGEFYFDTIPDEPFEIAIQAQGYEPLSEQKITPGKTDHRFELATAKERPSKIADKLKLDQPFPEITVVTTDGTKIDLNKPGGKFLFVDFWATWCGPCVVEIPNLITLNKNLGDRDDFLIVSISIDTPNQASQVKRFAKKKKMTWPLVTGKDSNAIEAADKCGVNAIPKTFLIAPDGKLIAQDLFGPTLTAQVKAFLDKEKGGK